MKFKDINLKIHLILTNEIIINSAMEEIGCWYVNQSMSGRRVYLFLEEICYESYK